MYVQCFHDGAITSLSRSPFYTDLILVVGGGTISIWKEKSPVSCKYSRSKKLVFFRYCLLK